MIIEDRGEHRAPATTRVTTTRARSQLTAAELAARSATDPHGESASAASESETFGPLARLNPHLDDAELTLLSDAVEHNRDVLIAYRDKNGSRSVREIQPQELYGKWLDSWCYLRNGQRDFTIANIESVSPGQH